MVEDEIYSLIEKLYYCFFCTGDRDNFFFFSVDNELLGNDRIKLDAFLNLLRYSIYVVFFGYHGLSFLKNLNSATSSIFSSGAVSHYYIESLAVV